MLKKCGSNLKHDNEKAIIIVKENIHDTDEDFGSYVIDANDNSVIRSVEHYKKVFEQAGLEVVDEKR